MKVLMINGSPHDEGCIGFSLKQMAKNFELENINSEIINIGTSSVHGCTACDYCDDKERCVFDDIVNTIIDKMDDADGIIVGTPVYFASANGSLIAILDRLFYAANERFKGKPAAAIASARRAGTVTATDEINRYFAYAQMPIATSTYWSVVFGEDSEEVAQDYEGSQTLYNLVQNMAWLIKSIDAGKKSGVEPPKSKYGEWTSFIR